MGAIARERLRVSPTGYVQTRRHGAKASWHAAALEEVRAPGRKGGYYRFSFSLDGQRFRCLLHRAVWWAAGRTIPEGQELNHKDGVKLNCAIGNLELVTPGGNQKHAWETGLQRRIYVNRGLSPEQVAEIRRRVAAGTAPTSRALAEEFKTTSRTLHRIHQGLSYRDV